MAQRFRRLMNGTGQLQTCSTCPGKGLQPGGIVSTFRQVVRAEGVRGLYKVCWAPNLVGFSVS